MIIRYDPLLLAKLKKVNARVRKSFKQKLEVFLKEPQNPELNNHSLKRDCLGYRSIDITSDWRAIFAEKTEDNETIMYFVDIDTHEKLYKK